MSAPSSSSASRAAYETGVVKKGLVLKGKGPIGAAVKPVVGGAAGTAHGKPGAAAGRPTGAPGSATVDAELAR